MPKVVYKLYLTAGHHRQPRNLNPDFKLSEGDFDTNPPYVPSWDLTPYGFEGKAPMLFWSVTDGSQGQTYPAGDLTLPQPVDPNVTVTAWYFPLGGGPGDLEIIDDAFSANKGAFIDDTFVTVTSDPSLTSQANVVGIVPTEKAETLVASAMVVSTPEPFFQWLSFGPGMPSSTNSAELDVPAKASGIAIAVYQYPEKVDFSGRDVQGTIYGTVTVGVTHDGGGTMTVNGVKIHIDPYGPLVLQIANASLTIAGSKGMDRRISERVQQLAAEAVLDAIKQALPDIEKAAGSQSEPSGR